jgi:hypothetical protein
VAVSNWFHRSDENRSKQYPLNTLFIVAESVERYKKVKYKSQTVGFGLTNLFVRKVQKEQYTGSPLYKTF